MELENLEIGHTKLQSFNVLGATFLLVSSKEVWNHQEDIFMLEARAFKRPTLACATRAMARLHGSCIWWTTRVWRHRSNANEPTSFRSWCRVPKISSIGHVPRRTETVHFHGTNVNRKCAFARSKIFHSFFCGGTFAKRGCVLTSNKCRIYLQLQR